MNDLFTMSWDEAFASLTPTPAVGTRLRVKAPYTMYGTVIAVSTKCVVVESEKAPSILYRLDTETLKDQDGDTWERVPTQRTRYRNVYADGTCSPDTHPTEAAARQLTKYGKVRIGIIEETREGDKTVSARMITTVPQLRTAHLNAHNPYA